jgi:hypothetical protein
MYIALDDYYTSRFPSHRCYDLIWEVVRGENQTGNLAIIDYGYDTLSEVFKRIKEYQLS